MHKKLPHKYTYHTHKKKHVCIIIKYIQNIKTELINSIKCSSPCGSDNSFFIALDEPEFNFINSSPHIMTLKTSLLKYMFDNVLDRNGCYIMQNEKHQLFFLILH